MQRYEGFIVDFFLPRDEIHRQMFFSLPHFGIICAHLLSFVLQHRQEQMGPPLQPSPEAHIHYNLIFMMTVSLSEMPVSRSPTLLRRRRKKNPNHSLAAALAAPYTSQFNVSTSVEAKVESHWFDLLVGEKVCPNLWKAASLELSLYRLQAWQYSWLSFLTKRCTANEPPNFSLHSVDGIILPLFMSPLWFRLWLKSMQLLAFSVQGARKQA